MTERDSFVTISDGDQLNYGYFNGIYDFCQTVNVKNTNGTTSVTVNSVKSTTTTLITAVSVNVTPTATKGLIIVNGLGYIGTGDSGYHDLYIYKNNTPIYQQHKNIYATDVALDNFNDNISMTTLVTGLTTAVTPFSLRFNTQGNYTYYVSTSVSITFVDLQ